MMRVVEMYLITIITLMMTTSQGSLRSCFHYCKLSPDHATYPRPDCDCSFHNIRKRSGTSKLNNVAPSEIKDSGIYYEPANLKSSHKPWVNETFHMIKLTPSIQYHDTKPNEPDKTLNTSKSDTIQDIYNQYNSKLSHKYKREHNIFFPNVMKAAPQIPLHLYLDIDLHTSENNNTSQLEEFTNMFEKFQATEKYLSECINLHVYIFSKYVDNNNKTNTNWGHKLEHDNLSNSQKLTEIQAMCNQTTTIIRQSIYEIKESYPRKMKTSKFLKDEQETIENVGSKQSEAADELYESSTIESATTVNNFYSVTSDTVIFGENDNVMQTTQNSYTKQDVLKLHKNVDLLNISQDRNGETLLNFTGESNPKAAAALDTNKLTGYNKIKTSRTDRTLYNEEEMQIPKIITKEFANGTVVSVVDGIENIPNSDFTTNNIISTALDEITNSYPTSALDKSTANPDLVKTELDEEVQSDLVEIQGNLYFLFDKTQIPARFIQQPDGEINVAIDGFSLCDQDLKENKSNFMNLLCNCIRQNCTFSYD